MTRALAAVIGTVLAGCQLVFPFDGDPCFGRDAVQVCPDAPLQDRRLLAAPINTNSANDCLALRAPAPDVCVVGAQRVEINGPVLVQGARSLVIIGGDIVVADRIDASGGLDGTQPATEVRCAGSTAAGRGMPAPVRVDSGGGFGGSLGTLGGTGGTGGTANNGGLPPPIPTERALLGGCPGGDGGSADTEIDRPLGAGGKGGGAIAILATGSIEITAAGSIDASGGGGGGGRGSQPGPSGGGGGGGAGGTILLDALRISSAGLVMANGGSGGGGGSAIGTGSPGSAPLDPEMGAGGGIAAEGGGEGGSGGTKASAAQAGRMGSATGAGGGGGGAVGTIIVISGNSTFDRVSPDPID